MLMGFILHFYIIFGTNLLTQGSVQIAVFLPVSVFRRKGISNGMKPLGELFLEQTWSRGLGVDIKKKNKESMRQGGAPTPLGTPSPLWAPRGSTDLLLPSIYTHIPWKHPGAPRNPISTAATFCTQEIPSWGLFRSSAGGGIGHGGPLHQLHGPSDDVWVVYHRPSGP